MKLLHTSAANALASALRTAESASHSPLPTPPLTPAQASAADRARLSLQSLHGALIADPPGSGKSFIALRLAAEAHAAGLSILLTAPAALAPSWRQLLRSAHVPFLWRSHTLLSRSASAPLVPPPDFILVDEAHAFRNPATRRYRTLARATRSARVLLLTASPINNSLMDLYFLLRLFLPDTAFADAGIPSLLAAFRSARDSRQPLPAPLRDALDSVVICRSRNELEWDGDDFSAAPGTDRKYLPPTSHHTPRITTFPRLDPPVTRTYDFARIDPDFLRDAIKCLEDLELAAFASAADGARPPSALLRLTLAKRLESGVAAFAASIRGLAAYLHAFLDATRQGYLIRPRDTGRLAPSDHAAQLGLAPVLGSPLPRNADTRQLQRSTLDDLRTLDLLLRRTRVLARFDPKKQSLLDFLALRPAGHRTLVFTEFRETAHDLFAALRDTPGTARLDGAGAAIASGPCSRSDILARFDPLSPTSRLTPVHTLIATDVIAEGLNLQRADCVVCYDLPWNPVRLIQRIGRVYRMGSPHARVSAVIFMPDHWLEEFTRLVDRLAVKLHDIRRGLGSTTPGNTTPEPHSRTRLDPDTPRDPLHTARLHATFLAGLNSGFDPIAEPHTPLLATTPQPLAALLELPAVHHATPAPAHSLPFATIPAVPPLPADGTALLLISQTTAGPRCHLVHGDTVEELDQATAASLLTPALVLPPPEMDPDAVKDDGTMTQLVLRAIDTLAAHLDRPRPAAARNSTSGRLIRRVITLAAPFAPLDPEIATLADNLVRGLRDGLHPASAAAAFLWERGLAAQLNLLQDPDFPVEALRRLDALLGDRDSLRPRTLAAAFLLVPRRP